MTDEEIIKKLAEAVYKRRLLLKIMGDEKTDWARAEQIFDHLKYSEPDNYLWRLNDVDLNDSYRKVYDECQKST